MYGYLRWSGAHELCAHTSLVVPPCISFDFQLMTDLYWNFRDEIWYDPSVQKEVPTELWIQDGEEITPVGWKNVPPLIQIIVISEINGEYSFQFKYQSIWAIKFLESNFICTIYEDKKAFLELRLVSNHNQS